MGIIKETVKKTLSRFGYRIENIPSDETVIDEEFGDIYQKCRPYTMTSKERMYALYKAVRYVTETNIQGDFVECGIWKGGSAMIIALTLLGMNRTDKTIYLYDTFEGMPFDPGTNDYSLKNKKSASSELKKQSREKSDSIWCVAPLEEVRTRLLQTGYPKEKIVFIKGKVEDTIPKTTPASISLLRLDTDWYESTKHELLHLFPLLLRNGVLIIDDYGFWAGSKKAVDEYFINKPILLNRIDSTGRIAVKI